MNEKGEEKMLTRSEFIQKILFILAQRGGFCTLRDLCKEADLYLKAEDLSATITNDDELLSDVLNYAEEQTKPHISKRGHSPRDCSGQSVMPFATETAKPEVKTIDTQTVKAEATPVQAPVAPVNAPVVPSVVETVKKPRGRPKKQEIYTETAPSAPQTSETKIPANGEPAKEKASSPGAQPSPVSMPSRPPPVSVSGHTDYQKQIQAAYAAPPVMIDLNIARKNLTLIMEPWSQERLIQEYEATTQQQFKQGMTAEAAKAAIIDVIIGRIG